jgi:hypothetical protein
MVAGLEMCSAVPARVGNSRAAQILDMLAEASEKQSHDGGQAQ